MYIVHLEKLYIVTEIPVDVCYVRKTLYKAWIYLHMKLESVFLNTHNFFKLKYLPLFIWLTFTEQPLKFGLVKAAWFTNYDITPKFKSNSLHALLYVIVKFSDWFTLSWDDSLSYNFLCPGTLSYSKARNFVIGSF